MKLIALVDCNNFFASCERVFRPDLDGKPVLVLSANDGCIIARSNEVKELGIEMGTPLFKVKDLVQKYKINIFSTNFGLYGALSSRVMKIIGEYTPNLEVYSIDEAFFELPNINSQLAEDYARKIVIRVKKETGIPISIGISNTKTLAKIACKYAKKNSAQKGVKFFSSDNLDQYLSTFEIRDIWGIGHSYTKSLQSIGISTALDLKNSDIGLMRKRYGVTMERTIMELNGTSCLPVGYFALDKKNILRSRSFGQKITQYTDIESAISTFIRIGGNDLRKHDLVAWHVSVFLRTDIFNHNDSQYRNYATITLPNATSDQILLNRAAIEGVKRIFRSGYYYKKAGILLTGIFPRSNSQICLGESINISDKNTKLFKSFDKMNYKYGKSIIHLASEKAQSKWHSKSQLKSSDYLSSWEKIPMVKAN